MKLRYYLFLALVAGVFFAPGDACAQEPAPAVAPAPGTRRALLICGLPGDADHRKLFAESIEKIYAGLTRHHGFSAENITVLWSEAPEEKDGEALRASQLLSRESLTEVLATLQAALQPEDALWVFVLGHMHYDGRYSSFNIPGDDIQQMEFGKLCAPLRCREQVFFITTSASGFYLKPLALPGRVVITATEPDFEVNETLFPQHLAKAIGEPPDAKELDIDADGRVSLLDVHLWTARAVAQEYVTAELLATEHALLDDTADGRGTEVQADYLSEELGGRLKAGADKPVPRPGDGDVARKIRLYHPPGPPHPAD
jgi:hypothetical protein